MPSAYPWGALEPVSRSATRVAAGVRQALNANSARTASALSELLELPSEIVVKRTQLGHAPALTHVLWLSAEQLSRVTGYIAAGVDEGARIVSGGEAASEEGLAGGYFVRPTVFTDVEPSMQIMREEIFGPVGMVGSFASEEEAVAAANDTAFGLAAGIWTTDVKRAHRVAASVHAGTVWVNTYGMFDAAIPYGGFKLSGYGKELGREALDQYLQTKTVWVDLG